MSALNRLTEALDLIGEDLVRLTRELPIRHLDNHGETFVIIAPSYHWGERTPEQKHKHLDIVRRYKKVFEIVSVWLHDAPNDLQRELADADRKFRIWLELGSNWSISGNKESNERGLRESTGEVLSLIEIFAAAPHDRLVLIPDTNSLLREPDPTVYRSVCQLDQFDFLLLPTVLRELDELKMLHRNPDVREKAEKMIKRIKGWRAQGPLLDGVVVDKSISVRAIHTEPNVSKSLSWLDPNSADDRIIASVLDVQSTCPSARIILVTGDVNLQNKADAAFIEVAELNTI
jgi:hypothetical protein